MGNLHHVGALPARLRPLEDGDVHLAAAGRAFHEHGYAGGAVKISLRPTEHGQIGPFFRGVHIGPVLVVADNGPAQAHGRLAGHHGYGYERRAALVVGEHEQPVQLVGIVASAGRVGCRFLIFHASGHDGGGGRIGRVGEGGVVLQDGAAGHPCVTAHGGGVNGLAGDGGIEHVLDKLAERDVERFLEIRAGTLRASGRTLLAACLLVATKSRTAFTVAASGSALPCGASASRVDSAVSSAGGSVPFFCSSACAGNAVRSAKQKQMKRRLKMDRGMMLSGCIGL